MSSNLHTPESKEGSNAEQEAMQAVVKALHDLLPPDGDHVEHHGFYLVKTSASVTVVITVDGRRISSLSSRDVDRAFSELRRVMYQPGVGSWFSVQMTVWADGHAKTEFNYDQDPVWGAPPGAVSFITDLQTYPIDEQNRPEWLKRYVAEGIEDLHRYGKKSYPPWLKRMIEAGNTPSWL